jgi:hypothetical protein
MNIRSKLVAVLLVFVALSTVTAMQYARADVAYNYQVSKITEGDIRYVAHDIAPDNKTVLRAGDENGTDFKVKFGKWARGEEKIYTAAFAIVNEEAFPITITDLTITGTGAQYIEVILHNNSNTKGALDTNPLTVWTYGTAGGSTQTFGFQLDSGDENVSTAVDTQVTTTPGSRNPGVHWVTGTLNAAGSDTVWVQIRISIPDTATVQAYTGNIRFGFSANP